MAGAVAIGTAAYRGAEKAIRAVSGAVRTGISEYSEQQRVAAQTNAVLKSTGGIAKVTAADVNQLSTSLMKKSGVDDEAIASAENWLLTFKNVRNEVGKGNNIFDQATALTVDLGVAMSNAKGGPVNLASASNMLGKALNDPIKGLTALGRAGVQFSDAQKEQIKSMVESGDLMGAQKLMLKELQSQVGGSAEAYGKTFPGAIARLRESWKNLMGDVVGRVAPVFADAIDGLMDMLPMINRLASQLGDKLGGAIERLAKAFKKAWPGIRVVLEGIGETIGDYVVPIWEELAKIGAKSIEAIGKVLKRHGPEIREIFRNLGEVIKNLSKVILPILAFAFEKVLPVAIRIAIPVLKLFSETLVVVTGIIADTSGAIGSFCRFFTKTIPDAFKYVIDWLKRNWPEVATIISGPFAPIVALATNAFGIRDALTTAFSGALGWLKTEGGNIAKGLLNGITGAWSAVTTWLSGRKAAIGGYFTSGLTWLTTAGGNIISGLQDGLKNSWSTVSGWLGGLPGKIKNCFAGAGGWLLEVGKSIIRGLKKGLASLLPDLLSYIKNKIVGAIKKIPYIDKLIGSPSPFFITVGEAMMKGLGSGIADTASVPVRALSRTVGAITSPAAPTLAAAAGGGNTYINVPLSNVWGDADRAALMIHERIKGLERQGRIATASY
jgi:phage-related protein